MTNNIFKESLSIAQEFGLTTLEQLKYFSDIATIAEPISLGEYCGETTYSPEYKKKFSRFRKLSTGYRTNDGLQLLCLGPTTGRGKERTIVLTPKGINLAKQLKLIDSYNNCEFSILSR